MKSTQCEMFVSTGLWTCFVLSKKGHEGEKKAAVVSLYKKMHNTVNSYKCHKYIVHMNLIPWCSLFLLLHNSSFVSSHLPTFIQYVKMSCNLSIFFLHSSLSVRPLFCSKDHHHESTLKALLLVHHSSLNVSLCLYYLCIRASLPVSPVFFTDSSTQSRTLLRKHQLAIMQPNRGN